MKLIFILKLKNAIFTANSRTKICRHKNQKQKKFYCGSGALLSPPYY